MVPCRGGVQIQAHVEDIGWFPYVSDGDIVGTTGRDLAIQAVRIKLEGDVAEQYDVYYRVHVADFGWLGWAKNDEAAGTTGISLQAEAIEVRLIEKRRSTPVHFRSSIF